MLSEDNLQEKKNASLKTIEVLRSVEIKNPIGYSMIGDAFLQHALTSYLLGEPCTESLNTVVDYYFKRFEMEEEFISYPVRIEIIHPMILTNRINRSILESFSEYKKVKVSFKPFFFHTFVLSNYLLGNYDAIEQYKEEILPAEEKKGGNHMIYKHWTKAILALIDKDEENFKKWLDTILKEHKSMQKKRYKNSVLGEISLPAISLLRLATQAGMKIDSDNPLAPNGLIELFPL